MSQYDFDFSVARPQSAHAIEFAMISPGSHVLDIGCHTGIFGEALKKLKHCTVTGIERDMEALREASTRLDRVTSIDVETSNWWKAIDGEFDVVLFGDVLEHTRDPAEVLRQSHSLLRTGGRVIVSVPNVANLRVRLGLLRGKFDYQESGILDKTHLRFFTKSSAKELVTNAGFRVTAFKAAGYSLPPWLIAAFPTLLATQFVMLCEPNVIG
jgi:O-antigen biosynthesis protein